MCFAECGMRLREKKKKAEFVICVQMREADKVLSETFKWQCQFSAYLQTVYVDLKALI
jgi:hypothetical protein